MEIKNSEWTEFAEFIARWSTHMVSWVTVNEPERKIKALSTRNFHFRRFYTLREYKEIDETTGKMKVQWFIGPCVSRI